MSDDFAHSNLEREKINRLESIAAGIFARHGVLFSAAKRAGGWSNATWLAGGLALRLSTTQGNENLSREARLAALLPLKVGYPTAVESGVTDGFAWCLSKEIPGRCLGEIWPDLDWEARTSALGQLWHKAQAVHSVEVTAAAGLARSRAWYNSTDAEEAATNLSRREQQGLITSRQAAVLRETLDRFWSAVPAAECVLVHGDLTLDNALWHQGQVVSLLDFEFALIAPVELDLNVLLKSACGPPGDQAQWTEADCTGQQRMRQAVADLAAPVAAQPGSADLLLGYAVLLELWQLENWLAHPEGEGPLEQWDPYRRLLSLADGMGGYLAPILAQTVS